MKHRLRFDLPSASPEQDATTLRDALRRSTSDWPIPGEWRIGYKAQRVVLQLDVPSSPVTRYRRIGLFRWEPYVVDEPQTPFAIDQLRQRWPHSMAMPKPTCESIL